jgi:hypothetical protein
MSILNRVDSSDILYIIFFLIKKMYINFFDNFNVISKFLGRLSSFEFALLPGIKSNIML